jgi:hypothetical protein
MADAKRKLGWLAALTLIAAGGLAACGEEDATGTGTAPAARVEASRGSDQHLYNQAADIAASSAVMGSDQHLYHQAADIAASSAVMGSDQHLYNQAAEIAGSQTQPGTVTAATGDAAPNVWQAGNRAAAAALAQG